MGSNLPVWVLAPKDEKEARQNLKKFAYGKCNEFVEAMANCAKANGVKVFPACTPQKDLMSECILSYQGSEYLDSEREKIVIRKKQYLEEQKQAQKQKE